MKESVPSAEVATDGVAEFAAESGADFLAEMLIVQRVAPLIVDALFFELFFEPTTMAAGRLDSRPTTATTALGLTIPWAWSPLAKRTTAARSPAWPLAKEASPITELVGAFAALARIHMRKCRFLVPRGLGTSIRQTSPNGSFFL